MTTRALYHVTVTTSFYAVSTDERSLVGKAAQYASRCVVDGEPDDISVRKVGAEEKVPEAWRGCFVYGDTSVTVEEEMAKLRRDSCAACGAERSAAGLLKHAEGCEAWEKEASMK